MTTPPKTPTTPYARLARSVTLTTIEGKRVLFSLRTGDTFGLNESAAALVEAMCAHDLDGAARRCAATFDAEEGELRDDLRALADELVGLGLLERA